MPKSSTPALLLTMVRSFVPLRRTAAMRFSGMPQRPKPPIRMVAPSWIFSMAASAEAIRLSIRCSEVFSAVYFIRHWSWKTVVIRIEVNDDHAKFVEFVGSLEASLEFAGGLIFKLQTAEELVEFVGGVEVGLELAGGEFFAEVVKAAGEEIE